MSILQDFLIPVCGSSLSLGAVLQIQSKAY